MLNKRGMVLLEALVLFHSVVLVIFVFTSFYVNFTRFTSTFNHNTYENEVIKLYEDSEAWVYPD